MSLEYNNKINGDLYSCLNLLIQSTEEIENDEYTGVAPIGPGLHFIQINEKNKTSKFAIKIEGVVTLADPGGARCLKFVEHRYQKASECTIELICFQFFLCISKYRIK